MKKQQKVLKIISTLIITIAFISCQTKPDKSFVRIPNGLSEIESLIKKIHPDQNYKYWACIISNPLLTEPKTEVVAGKGGINELMKFKFTPPDAGFKNEIWKGYYYIAYLKNNKIDIVSNEKNLILFLGGIHSLNSAMLIAKIRGFNIDYKRSLGSSYKKVRNGYELYLVKFHKCPVKTEPFKVFIDSFGNCNYKSLGFYYNVDDQICAD